MSSCYITAPRTTIETFHAIAIEEGFAPVYQSKQTHYVDEDGNMAVGVRQWGNRVYFERYAGNYLCALANATMAANSYDEGFDHFDRLAHRSACRKPDPIPTRYHPDGVIEHELIRG